MDPKTITFNSSRILDILKSISTRAHAKAVLRRNSQTLSKGWSRTPCPHCRRTRISSTGIAFKCRNCLWARAILLATGQDASFVQCPCLWVSFGRGSDPEGLSLRADEIRTNYSTSENQRFLQAHADWANEPGWGSDRKGRKEAHHLGFRTEVTTRKNFLEPRAAIPEDRNP